MRIQIQQNGRCIPLVPGRWRPNSGLDWNFSDQVLIYHDTFMRKTFSSLLQAKYQSSYSYKQFDATQTYLLCLMNSSAISPIVIVSAELGTSLHY